MKAIDPAKRAEVWSTYLRLRNISKVAQKLHLCHETVRRWVNRHKQKTRNWNLRKRGRKPVLDVRVAGEALEMLLSGKYSGAGEVANVLFRQGLVAQQKPVSRMTVTRHAKALAEARGMPIACTQKPPKKALSRENKLKRLNFCKSNLRRCWANVMFTDRKRFLFKHPRTRVHRSNWYRVGKPAVAAKVNHPMGVNMYVGMTKFGMTRPHLVSGTSKMQVRFKNKKGAEARNITRDEYELVMLNTFLKDGKKLFGSHGVTSWLVQQDNDPSHKVGSLRALDKWRRSVHDCRVGVLPGYPPNSPDLNPVENLWALVDAKMQALGCKTFTEFQENLVYSIQHIPKEVLSHMYQGMRKRLQECIHNQGGRIQH